MMAQYAKYVRPDFVRVDTSGGAGNNVHITAYKKDGQLVVVAVNTGNQAQTLTLHIQNGAGTSFTQITSSGSKNLSDDGAVSITDHLATVTLDGQSATTLFTGNPVTE